MSILNPITKRYLTYTVDKLTPGATYLKGRRVNTIDTVEIELCIMPIDFQTLNSAPESDYTSQDIKIYREGTPDQLPDNSIIYYKNNTYSIRQASDRTDEGGFSMWYGKRITPK